MIDLGSDTAPGMAPAILAAIIAANRGSAPAYGADAWTKHATHKLASVFEADLEGFLVGNGTAANALALAHLAQPWTTILCHEAAHVAVAESNAPEYFSGGAKVVGLGGIDGKVAPDSLTSWLDAARSGPPGRPRASVLSLTQCTDLGGVYTRDEIVVLSRIAHAAGLVVHVDGARLATALAATGCSPAEMTWQAGVDVLSLGSSKGGTMNAEAVLFFDRECADGFPFRLRQAGHVVAKGRFLGAQMSAWLEDERWLTLARHANRMAVAIAAALVEQGAVLHRPVAANLVFASLPPGLADALERRAVRYAGPPQRARFVASWATTDTDIAAVSGRD